MRGERGPALAKLQPSTAEWPSLSVTNLPEASSLLTDTEKFFFDLRGFLIVRGAVAAEDVAAMAAIAEQWMSCEESEIRAPLERHPPPPGGHKTHFPNAHYGNPLFDRLNQNPLILRVVSALLLGKPRLSQCTLAHMTKGEWQQNQPAKLHRDDHGFKFPPGFRNPFNDYQTANGEIYCSHVATWVALAPVPAGTGFAVVPGSHKSTFALPGFLEPRDGYPAEATGQELGPVPAVVTLPLAAGDVVVFSTALFHDAAAWTEDYPRLNVFQRFTLSAYFGEFGPDNTAHHSVLSADGAELEKGSYGDHEPQAVVKMRRHFGGGRKEHRSQRTAPYNFARL
jgi:ectoine hydroxylase-related dioxygenase (phytanoyl-CoA dioxygenase family)